MSDIESSTPEQSETETTNWALLASERFGDDFKGEVPEAEEPAPEETEQLAEAEESPQEVEEVEETAEETENDAESADLDEDEVQLDLSDTTLQEVLSAEGYDLDEFMQLKVEQKVNGETRLVTLSEMLATDQTLESAKQRLDDAKDKAKSQYQALAQKEQALDEQFAVSAAMAQKQRTQFAEQEKALMADPLRQQDPAEWTAKRQELQDRKAEFEKDVTELVQGYQQSKQQKAAETQAAMQQRLEAEQAKLLDALPEWKSEKTRTAGQKKLQEYLLTEDLTPESINAVSVDHKLLVMAEKARKFDEIQTKAEPAKKRLVKVPKGLKPGAKPAPVNKAASEIAKLEKQLAANPNNRDSLAIATKLQRLKRRGK